MQKGRLFVISGPSGVGKGTICKKLIENRQDIELSISATTRKPRKNEVDGKHYYFITKEEFIREIDNGGFIEYAEVFGNFYGTPKKNVYERLEKGINVILEIDVQGALQVKEVLDEAILIFIMPPSKAELRSRLSLRATDEQDVIERRLAEACREIELAPLYDYVFVNDDLEKALQDIDECISSFGADDEFKNKKDSIAVLEMIKNFEEGIRL
ncbi:MAG: guanylate kinase [Eubacteriales bacterium]|nr:guanylate kinase [Eubacteriales bacterium]MDY3332772.1 guanylate kinase [Gallibacter sp.]